MHFVCEIYKMSTHFKWYPGSDDVVVPWNARYSFPSQANKTAKLTPRIPPKNGAEFSPGNVIRLEFPAQGYVNPSNTTLSFDVQITAPTGSTQNVVRFQNNIQSIFSRVRLLYGSTPIEDIVNYNVVVRALTEWSSSNPHVPDQAAVSEGIGGVSFGATPNTNGDIGASTGLNAQGMINVRQAHIHGIDQTPGPGTKVALTGGAGFGSVPNADLTRKYQISFALGMFTQEKLIPTKFMASQLAIEITLETAAACMIHKYDPLSTVTLNPSYIVKNVNLIPEILEFDASYDSMFLMGLQQGGVPIKFSSWHTYLFSSGGGSRLNLQIQERSRSVKALFAVQRRSPADFKTDSGALHFVTMDGKIASNGSSAPTAQTLQDYQYRIGGRYFPAAPVQCSLLAGSSYPNGGAEALVELQKALNQVGDYRLSTAVNSKTWGIGLCYNGYANGSAVRGCYDYPYSEHDFCNSLITIKQGIAIMSGVASHNVAVDGTGPALGNAFAGNTGSANFGMAIDLETSNGVEISGLNAEEQVIFIYNPSLIFLSLQIILVLKKKVSLLRYTHITML
jgi:hypothetical protein